MNLNDSKLKLNKYIRTIFFMFQLQIAIALPASISTDDTNAIYQDTDKYGNVVITNKPKHVAAKQISLPALVVSEKPMTQKDLNSVNSDSNINNYGTIQPGRRYVLQEELTKEITALHEAMSMFEYNKNLPLAPTDLKHQERIKIIQDAINEHQKNIAILQNTLK